MPDYECPPMSTLLQIPADPKLQGSSRIYDWLGESLFWPMGYPGRSVSKTSPDLCCSGIVTGGHSRRDLDYRCLVLIYLTPMLLLQTDLNLVVLRYKFGFLASVELTPWLPRSLFLSVQSMIQLGVHKKPADGTQAQLLLQDAITRRGRPDAARITSNEGQTYPQRVSDVRKRPAFVVRTNLTDT